MPPRRLCILPLCLAAALHDGHAQDVLPLRGAAQLSATTPGQPRPAPTISLEADQLEGRGDHEVVAEGSVVLQRDGEHVEADWLRYRPQEDEVEARGRIRFSKGLDRLEGSYLKLRIAERLGEFKEVRYLLHAEKGGIGRGGASSVAFQGPDKYQLEQASYTTCPPGNDDWLLQTADLKLDYVASVGTARNVKVRYLDTPILYAPWMDFALDDRRKSGFLTPSYGVSDQRGIEVLAPWYWNIAANRDATLYPRVMTKRGVQLGAEFRYLEPAYGGDLAVEYLPNDRQADRERHRALLRHSQQFSPAWSGTLDYERVSDDSYFSDLSNLVRETSKVNLLQEGALNYDGGWWQASGRVQRFQTLQDPTAPITQPYRRLPQLVVQGARLRPGDLPLRLDLGGEFVRFDHPDASLATGNRLDLYPRVSLPLANNYAFVTPKLGWRYSRYDLERNPGNPTALDETRSLPIASLDTGLFLERDWRIQGRDYLQTLEPRAYFVYIPFEDQANIPIFDTAQRDLSLDQLFSENQFSGADRVNDANQMTLALTTRLLEPGSGTERLQVTVGQRYYFNDQRVALPGQTARGSDSTDLLLHTSGQVTDRWRLLAGLQFNTDDGETVKANLGGAYRQGPGKVFNIDYRYTNERYAPDAGLDQLDLSARWPLMARWHGLGRINYSFQESRLVEGLIGFEYNAGCWSLRGVAQRLATNEDQASNAFFLQLELHGLTALGPNPLDVLKRSITGYTKHDEHNLP